jgi:Helix-turn-helix domain
VYAVDDTLCRQYFLRPTQVLHRRYEVLRAFFIEGRSQADIAAQFGLSAATVQSLVRDFRAQVLAGEVPPFFGSLNWGDPQGVQSRR